MSVICLSCEGWGCLHCQSARIAAAGGEQGPVPLEVEVEGLRRKVAQLQTELAASDAVIEEHKTITREYLGQIGDLAREADSLRARVAELEPGRSA